MQHCILPISNQFVISEMQLKALHTILYIFTFFLLFITYVCKTIDYYFILPTAYLIPIYKFLLLVVHSLIKEKKKLRHLALLQDSYSGIL